MSVTLEIEAEIFRINETKCHSSETAHLIFNFNSRKVNWMSTLLECIVQTGMVTSYNPFLRHLCLGNFRKPYG